MKRRYKPSASERLQSIYDALPVLKCQARCQEACGPIVMTKFEWERIQARLGYTPVGDASLNCPMLDPGMGTCTVYDIRPAICRLFGMVETLRCKWGCIPERYLTHDDGHAILAQIERAVGER